MTDNITLPRSVVEQALEALFMYKPMVTGVTFQHGLDAMQELRAALKQPQVEQEPVAWLREDGKLALNDGGMFSGNWKPLYTHPQNLRCKSTQARLATLWGYEKKQPKREPLTDEEIQTLLSRCDEEQEEDELVLEFARVIERAHGIGGKQ